MKTHLNLRNYFVVLVFLAVLGTVWSSSAFADCELARLLASDGAAGDYFGYSVSVWGDTAIIGARGDDANGSGSGSAYIFRFDGANWVEEQKLIASDGAAGDWFGGTVSIWGDTAVIGAHLDDANSHSSGSAYIFHYSGTDWVEQAKLTASDGAVRDFFGCSVAISGNTAVVGAYADDDNGKNSGSAYIFRYDGSSWVEEAKLTASDGAADDLFGRSIGIWGDTAVIGADGDDDNGSGSGSAYIFRFDGSSWVEEAKLTASDGVADDLFGRSVGIWGDTAVIGADGDDDNGSGSGSAYIFRFDGANWVQKQKLTASDGSADDLFGRSVGIWGDTAVIGADGDDDNGSVSGSAYIFRFDGANWVEEAKLLASDGAAADYFGASVAISGDTAVIGAYYDDDNGDSSGSAYIFELEGATWEKKLLASDGAENDIFGVPVAISGNIAVVGAYGDDDNGLGSGSAYIFRNNGIDWVEETKLLASSGAEGDRFGYSVAVSGDTAVVGAYNDDDNGLYSGSAYLFRYNGTAWVEETKLLASDGAEGDVFAWSVSISGDTVVVGASHDDDKGSDSGSVYIFRYNGSSWVEETKLTASDGEENKYFGRSVAICGDTAIIGVDHDDANGSFSGSAYIFHYSGTDWVEQTKLTASDGAVRDFFGCSVAISGTTAVVGAYADDDNGNSSGSAYIFRNNGTDWIEEAKLIADDSTENDGFGHSVAIYGNNIVVGSPHDDDNGSGSGSAYTFRYNGTTWIQDVKLTASDGVESDQFGTPVSISGDNVAVGTYGSDDLGQQSGSVYIFGLSMHHPGDLDLDNDVDFIDHSLFAPYWLESDCGPCNCDRADFTRDGSVDVNDLRELTDNWLKGK